MKRKKRNEINQIECVLLFFSFTQPLPPLPSVAQQPLGSSQQAFVSTTTQTTSLSMIKPTTSVASTTTPTGVVKPTPSIAVTHTQSIEREERALLGLRSKPTSPSKRKDGKKHLPHKSKHSALDRIHRWEEEERKTAQKSIFDAQTIEQKEKRARSRFTATKKKSIRDRNLLRARDSDLLKHERPLRSYKLSCRFCSLLLFRKHTKKPKLNSINLLPSKTSARVVRKHPAGTAERFTNEIWSFFPALPHVSRN